MLALMGSYTLKPLMETLHGSKTLKQEPFRILPHGRKWLKALIEILQPLNKQTCADMATWDPPEGFLLGISP